MIFIVSHRRGFEADRVIDRLRNLGEPFFRFNTDLDNPSAEYSATIDGQRHCLRIRCDDRDFDLSEATAGWFQQPFPWHQPLTALEGARHASHKALIYALLDQIRCRWINTPANAHRAANKPLQLLAAVKVGLPIPETLISNYANDVRFFLQTKNEVIVKSVAPQWIHHESEEQAAYTQKLDQSWVTSDESIAFSPITYQTFQPRRRDIRAVVIGNKIFAASCEEQGEAQRYDIRKAEHPVYRRFDLPDTICSKLMKVLNYFGINFCSADFIENHSGDLMFVDLNVTGSWWWIDSLFDGGITEAITLLLLQLKADQ